MPHFPGFEKSGALSVGTPDESDPIRFRYVEGTVEHIWQGTGSPWPLVSEKMDYVADRPLPAYGNVSVRDLVSRLLDEDPEAPLVMTGGFPLYLRVGRRVHAGGPRVSIVLQEAPVWEN